MPRMLFALHDLRAADGSEAADRFAANVKPIIAEIRKSGATSLRAVAAALTARGVPTGQGHIRRDALPGRQATDGFLSD